MNKYSPPKEKILLIGGSGFIGSNIISHVVNNYILNDKYELVVLSRSYSKIKFDFVTYEIGDYGDRSTLIDLFNKWNFKYVFHCATTIIPNSINNNYLREINDNLNSTIELLNFMKYFKCNSIIFLSSGGAIYGHKNAKIISENDNCEPLSSYGIIKQTIENYIKLYNNNYGIDYLILRISNPFGKYHFSDSQGIINISIRRTLRNQKIDVWGDGTQSKDFIYADDLSKIIFLLIEGNNFNLTLNIGTGESIELNNVFELIRNTLPNLQILYTSSKNTDVKNYCLDVSRLKNITNLTFTNFKQAISETIEWEKSII
jgi:UDP-glucose 4-epimerase